MSTTQCILVAWLILGVTGYVLFYMHENKRPGAWTDGDPKHTPFGMKIATGFICIVFSPYLVFRYLILKRLFRKRHAKTTEL